MTAGARYSCFVNSGAAAGAAGNRLRSALHRRPDLERRCDVAVVRSRQELRAALRAMPRSSIPVAVGGDGTANWLVSSLRELGLQDRPVAVLPLGTGNAFAHSLGLGRMSDALEALVSGVEREIDVMATTHPDIPVALVSISVGFESQFLGGVAAERSWRRLASGAIGLFAAIAPCRAGLSLSVDAEPIVREHDRVFNAGLYCMPCYALGRVVLPEADLTDGAAEAVVCRSRGAYWKTLCDGVRLSAPEARSDLMVRRWTFATVAADEALQMDGDAVAAACFDVRVEPRGLRVVVPG